MVRPGPLTDERKKTHGDWPLTASITCDLKAVLADAVKRRNSKAITPALTPGQREALDMVMAKIARIVSGDPNHPDHWDDIAGYALLGKGGAA